jgi:ribA/ribD-fused uncharacterized protein
MNVTDKHVLFWGEWPSNWYPAEFDVEVLINGEKQKKHFFNSEQYFMYMKAIVFGDYDTAEKILKTKNPKKAKALGREVKNYDDNVWNEMRYKIMVDANKAKYGQNKELADVLTSEVFKGRGFVEASPVDGIWGIRMSENDPLADDEANWKGTNLLGKALDETREWLLTTKKGED